MTDMDIENLLAPISADSPCGEDVEYDEAYIALQIAAAGKPEQQVGDSLIAAEEPDWAEVATRAMDLLSRSKDLRVACRLTQALLHSEGVTGLHAGMKVVRGFVEHNWDSMFPRLDADDDYDPAIRVNALALLNSLRAVVHPLREAALFRIPTVGPISARLIAQVNGVDAPAAEPDRGLPHPLEIESAMLAFELSSLQAIAEAAEGARSCAAAIESEFAQRTSGVPEIDLGELSRALAEIESIVAPVIARRSGGQAAVELQSDHEEAVTVSVDELPCVSSEVRSHALGRIRSRSDVACALDAICEYLQRHEPSSPVPILLERAKRWVGMDFMAVLQDLSPDAAREAERLRGTASVLTDESYHLAPISTTESMEES